MTSTSTNRSVWDEYGPYHDEFLQFAMRSADDIANPDSLYTAACRYWQGEESIFMTHFRWSQGGRRREMSRVTLIDIWLAATNLSHYMRRIEGARYRAQTSAEETSAHQELCKDFIQFRSKVRVNLRNLGRPGLMSTVTLASFFSRQVAPLELRNMPPTRYIEPELTPGVMKVHIAPYVDITQPTSSFPFQIAALLKTIVESNTHDPLLEYVANHYQVTPCEKLELSGQDWRWFVESVPDVQIRNRGEGGWWKYLDCFGL